MSLEHRNDAAFDELLQEAGGEYVRQMLAEMPDDGELAGMFPETPSLDQKMESVFRRERRDRAARKAAKWGKRAAVICLVALGTCFATIFSVKALRAQFLSMFIEPHEEYTAFSFQGEEEDVLAKAAPPVVNDYEVTYLPDGYREMENDDHEYMRLFTYENDEGDIIHLSMMEATGTGISLDTENAETGKAEVNGNESFWVQKEMEGSTYVTILWHDNEWAFILSGQEPYGEMLRTAEGIRKQ